MNKADKSRLRDKESWITTAKKELECSDLLDEVRLEALKEIRGLKDKMREICNSSRELVDAVEKYIRQECLRSELMIKKDKLKELLK